MNKMDTDIRWEEETFIFTSHTPNTTIGTGRPTLNVPSLPGLILLILVTCGGNVLLVACICSIQRLRNTTNMYIASLAVADFLVGLIVMSGMLDLTLYREWTLGWVPCTIWATFDFACCTVSMLHLCMLAYERNNAIVNPLRHRAQTRHRRAVICISACWILGILAWAPAVIIFREQQKHTIPLNDCFFVPDKRYVLPQTIIVYFGPICTMIYLYARILHTLRKRRILGEETILKKMPIIFKSYKAKKENVVMVSYSTHGEYPNNSSNQQPRDSLQDISPNIDMNSFEADFSSRENLVYSISNEGAPSKCNQDYGRSLTIRRIKRERAKQRTHEKRCVITLGVVMISFLICWLPFCTFWPIKALCDNCIPAKLYSASYWMAYCNSTLNPLIYFIVNRDFRQGLVNLCRCKRNANRNTLSSGAYSK